MSAAGVRPGAADRLLRERRSRRAAGGEAPGIPRLPDDRPVRLSFSQERLWFLDRLAPGEPTYLIPAAFHLEGPLDGAALDAALAELVRRHEALRTRIVGPEEAPDGEGFPVQAVEPAGPAAAALGRCPRVDLAGLAREAARVEARRLARAEAGRPMALEGGPLVRRTLARLAPEEHLLLVTLHHAVADGWSVGVLGRELRALHDAFAAGRRPPLPEPSVRFRDVAAWQRQRLSGTRRERHLAYWRERLAGAPALLELPTDRPRPPVEGHRGGRVRFELPAAAARGVEELGRSLGPAGGGSASPFMVLLAAFQLLLGRLAGARDVVVGTPVAGRDRVETEGVVGFFANTVALRTALDPDEGFRSLVARVRDGVLADLAHQEMPFEELVAALQPQRDLSHAPIFQVLFVLQNASRAGAGGEDGGAGDGLRVGRSEAHGGGAKFDLTMGLVPVPGGGLLGTLEYRRDLFDAATAERWAGHYATLLSAALAAPDRPVGDLPFLADAEEDAVVTGWNRTARTCDGPALLHELVLEQARRTPALPAVRFRDRRLDYRGLDAASGRLARRLAALGVGPEVAVGVAMERSLELPVALLAVLRAGGAYLPLDPSYPEERLRFMVADGLRSTVAGAAGERPAVVLTQEPLRARLAALAPEGVRLLAVDDAAVGETGGAPGGEGDEGEPPGQGALPESPAYVIYTSGSTGRPKGTVNSHRAIRNRLLWMQEAFGIGPGDRVLQKTPFSFDVSVWELFWPLLTGAEMVVAEPEGHRDPGYLVRTIAGAEVTTLHFVPSMLQVFLDEPGVERLSSVRRVVASGEALPADLVRRFHERMGGAGAELHNLYGPTEVAVDVSWHPCTDPNPERVPIGRPIANLRLHVLDPRLGAAPPGVAGHLALAGVGLARGYHARPGLTADRFRPDPFAGRGDGPAWAPGGRIYLTGDLARHLPDGEVEYLGRLDHQVKVRGLRVELGEIEAALGELPEVREGVVLALPPAAGAAGPDLRLVAYLVPAAGAAPEPAALRAALERRLPEHMVPGAFVLLDGMPVSPSGKADRAALASRLPEAPAGRAPGTAPAGGLGGAVAEVWRRVLGHDRFGAHDNFFDVGGHSLLAVAVQRELRRALGREVAVVDLFRFPTVAALAGHLAAESGSAETAPADAGATEAQRSDRSPAVHPAATARAASADRRIAVVGMAGRFPGSPDLDAFWANLRDGVDCVRRWSRDELAAAGVPPELLDDPDYVPAGAPLDDADLFDAGYFGLGDREVELLDPQQRVFLEAAVHALEDAALDPRRFGGRVAVFAGSGENRHLFRIAARPELVRAVGSYRLMLANKSDYLPTRAAYLLGLTGPAVNVQTACSTSLAAIHLACRSLLDGECDAALAGGVSVGERRPRGYLHEAGGIASPDGRTRTFDEGAAGTVRGHGVGIVVLRRLADALADADPVRAVILGSAANNDGADKAGFTAPSVGGQAAAVRAAQRAAGVGPAEIGYVEAHGTGTALGDPIEVAALGDVFAGGAAEGGCLLGSVKANVGHLDAAAGVAGLIKTVLCLERELLPPTLHFRRPNPALDLARGPFRVVAQPTPWPAGERPRRAGVSSFGIGGTNVHAVVEEAPRRPAGEAPAPPPGAVLLVLSARGEAALDAASDRLADRLEALPEERSGAALADVGWTLQTGRFEHPHRRVLVASTGPGGAREAARALRERDPRRLHGGRAADTPPPVAFLLPGQGTQRPGMARGLYRGLPAFREALDRCADLARPAVGLDLRELLLAEPGDPAAGEKLARTRWAQPALFAFEHALATWWRAAGVIPRAMAGHSLGELVAACLAGVFPLDDALVLVAERGRSIDALPEGDMVAAGCGEAVAAAAIAAVGGGAAVAAINGPGATTVAGPATAVAAVARRLERDGIACRRLDTSHAFHSPAVEPAVEPFRERVAAVRRAPPAVPFVSNVTGAWVRAEEAVDPAYWARHLRAPVRFEGVAAALGGEGAVLLEVGPGRVLGGLVRRQDGLGGAAVLASAPGRDGAELADLLATAGRLWLLGVPIDWRAVSGPGRRRVRLPGYPFQRRSFWVEAPDGRRAAAGCEATAAAADSARSGAPPPPAAAGPGPIAAAGPEVRANPGLDVPVLPGGGPSPAGPGDSLEERIATVWRELLGGGPVGVDEDFFERGGSSLVAVQLAARLRRELGVPVDPHALLDHPTVAALAGRLREAGVGEGGAGGPAASPAAPPRGLLVPLRAGGDAPPLVLVHPAGGHVFYYRHLVAALPPARPVWGFRAAGLEPGEEPGGSIEDLAGRYVAALAAGVPSGPVHLAGSSMGGSVAWEMARRLGGRVASLTLVDTFGPGQMPERGAIPLPEDRRSELFGATRPEEVGDLERVRRVIRANVDAMYVYAPPPWEGRLTFVRATLRTPGEPRHPELPWLELARGGVEVHVLPGGHNSLHAPPHVAALAARIGAALSRADEIMNSCPAFAAQAHS